MTGLTSDPNLLLLAGVALITTWLMLRLRKKHRNPTRSATPAEQLERQRQVRGMRGDLEEVMVEVEQLAKRFSAQLDAKSMRLEKLIDEADARIAELERRQPTGQPAAEAPRQEPQPLRVFESSTASQPSPPDADQPDESEATRTIYRLADAGNDAVEIARVLDEHVGKVELILALREA